MASCSGFPREEDSKHGGIDGGGDETMLALMRSFETRLWELDVQVCSWGYVDDACLLSSDVHARGGSSPVHTLDTSVLYANSIHVLYLLLCGGIDR